MSEVEQRALAAERALLRRAGFFEWGKDHWIHRDDEGTVMEHHVAVAQALGRPKVAA